MVTIEVHVMSCSGIVLLLLAAMLELVFTMYALLSVFNLGLNFFLHSAVSLLLSHRSLQMMMACHVVLLWYFERFLLLLSFGAIY